MKRGVYVVFVIVVLVIILLFVSFLPKQKPSEKEKTMLFLSQFKTAAVDQECIDMAGSLYRKWNPTHGSDINDMILSALAIKFGGMIFCLSKKHYPLPHIVVEKPW